jgi:hypothetical protein
MGGTGASDEPLTAAGAARLRALLLAQVALVVGGAIAAALGAWLLAGLFPEASTKLVGWMVGLAKVNAALDKALGDGAGARLVVRLPWLCAGLAGAVLAWRKRGLVRRAADRWFPPRDADLLRPVERAGALDPIWAREDPKSGMGMQAFAWAEPPGPSPGSNDPPTARRHLWEKLLAFLSNEVGDGRRDLWGRPRVPLARFRWIVLTGQPGAGKTRMAMELARARARRDVLEIPLEPLGPEQRREHRRAACALWLGAWWRNMIPWVARRERGSAPPPYGTPWQGCDPWDAWWLVSTRALGRPQHRQRPGFESSLERLARWRPRRPTVLLLDDPLESDAGRVVATLLKVEAFYRHPVRLLVVSQTVPTDLKIRDQDRSWRSDYDGFAGDVLKLDRDAALGPAEVRMMDGSLGRRMEEFYRKQPGQRQPIAWKPDTASVNRLLRRTAGNALLVGLALYRVYRYPSQPEVPRETLLGDRAEQIVDALRVAGIGPEGVFAIAAATLAGPHATPSPGALTKETRFDPERLNLVPNLYHLPAPAPPIVQPEPIGDAFVRYVLSEKHCAPDRRQQVIAAAWQAAANSEAPAAMLRNARRLSVDETALARALREGPPPEAGLDELTVALAHAQWAVQIPRTDWDQGDVPGPAPLPPLQGGYSDPMPNIEEEERYAALRTYASEALRFALERLQALPPGIAEAALERFVSLLEVENAVAIVRGDAAHACFFAIVGRGLEDKDAWADAASASNGLDAWIRFFTAMVRWGMIRQREVTISVAYVLLLRRAALALGPDPDGVRRVDALGRLMQPQTPPASLLVPAALIAISDEYGDQYGLLGKARLNRIQAASVAFGFDIGATSVLELAPTVEEIARKVDEIARLFAGNREFELERARTWTCVSSVRRMDRAGCEAAAQRVDEIADCFAGDRDFVYESVRAWVCVVYSLRHHPDECKTTAERVDELSLPFGSDRDFEYERARTWSFVAEARCENHGDCEIIAGRVDEIARRFKDDRDFELERARTWANIVTAGWKGDCESEAIAHRIDEIARPHAGERSFEFERARAWGAASARMEDPGMREEVARRVDEIARPFAGDFDFELQRALVWVYVADMRIGNATWCEALAQRVDEIAHSFAGERDLELRRAEAWRNVCFARGDNPSGCEAAARLVDEIAQPFVGERTFEYKRAQAWRVVCSARRADLEGCETAAQRVDDLVRPFASERVFEHERAVAWRVVGYARLADPVGCEVAARRVDEIALPFAGDREFELERARGWVYVGYARVADPAGCEAAARRVDEIAHPYAGDGDFERLRWEAWGNLRSAPPDILKGA